MPCVFEHVLFLTKNYRWTWLFVSQGKMLTMLTWLVVFKLSALYALQCICVSLL